MPSEAPGVIKTPSTYHCVDTVMGLRPVFCVGWRSRATASACGARAVRVPCCFLAAAARPAIGDVAALASARQPARVRDLGVRLLYVFVANTCLIGTYDFFSMVAAPLLGGCSSRTPCSAS